MMTYEQRTALAVVIKHVTETSLEKIHRIKNEYFRKVLCEQKRYAREMGEFDERKN